MKIFILSLTLYFSLSVNISFSQVNKEWTLIPAVENISDVKDLKYNSNNTFIFLGESSFEVGYILCFNKEGNVLWSDTINESKPSQIACDEKSNVYYVGSKDKNVYLAKYNEFGIREWERYYDYDSLNSDDCGKIVKIDTMGNIIVAADVNYRLGDVISAPPHGKVAVLKYSPHGDLIWSNVYSVNSSSSFSSVADIVLDKGSAIYVSVLRDTLWYNGPTLFIRTLTNLIKYDSTGNLSWNVTYSVPFPDATKPVSMDYDYNENSIVIFGSVRGHFYTLKYDTSGKRKWLKEYFYNNPQTDACEPKNVKIDKNSNIYLCGSVQVDGSIIINDADYFIMKYSSIGDILWHKKFNGLRLHGIDICNDFLIGNKNLYCTGYLTNSETGKDEFVAGIDNNGNTLWTYTFDSSNADTSNEYSILIESDYSGSVYSAGYTNEGKFYINKYSEDKINIKEVSSKIPQYFKLQNNFPNPFNPYTKITFEIPFKSFTKLTIIDLLGRIIMEPVNEILKPGIYNYNFDASRFASGVYFYRLEAGEFVQTKRMVLVK